VKTLASLAAACALAAAASHAAGPASTAQPEVQVLPPLEIAALHRPRTVRLYLPPSYAGAPARRYPVIYMHDGQNLFDDATAYAGEWGVDESMNALARTRGFEAIVVGIDNGGELREREYLAWTSPRVQAAEADAYAAWVVETLKPWIDAHWRTQPGRESTAMIGSSYGALVTNHALVRYPQAIGMAGILSPSYYVDERYYDETKAHPWPAGTRTYFHIGDREHEDGDPAHPGEVENVPDVERMVALLAAQGHGPKDVLLRIEPGAHHAESAWRAAFPRVVAWLFELPSP
jgi:predicted alpha/beta superfamily hydrolase